MEYNKLGLKSEVLWNTTMWNGMEIKVKESLPIDKKYDIVMITLQEAFENGIYNPIKLELYFHVNLVLSCVDLDFTDEERSDKVKLYNEMHDSGFLDVVLDAFDEVEYKEMLEDIEAIAETSLKYNSSAAAVLREFIEDLPEHAAAAQKIVDNFDPNKYKAVVDFAKAANGGRKIPNNVEESK